MTSIKNKNPRGPMAWFLVLSLFLPLWGCSGGNGNGGAAAGGATVSANIGPAGGQISTNDGALTLVFPPGALTTTEMISITAMQNSQLSSAAQMIAPDRAWRLEPDGLSFLLPVTVEIDLGVPPIDAMGQLALDIPAVLVESTVGIESLGGTVTLADLQAGTTRVRGGLGHFSNVLAKSGVFGAAGAGPVPPPLAPGSSATIAGSIIASPGVTINNAMWKAVSTGVTDDLSDSYIPFSGLDAFEVTCSQGGGGGQVEVAIQFTATKPAGATLIAFNESFEIEVTIPVSCSGGGGGVFVVQDGTVQLNSLLQDLESAQVISTPGSNFAPPGGMPFILVAGGNPNGIGTAAAIVDPSGLTPPLQIPVGSSGTAFDAHFLRSPSGNREALFITGTSGLLIETFTGGQLAMGAQVSMGFHEDATEVAMDASKGIVAAVGAGLKIATIDDQNGPQLNSFNFSQQLRSGVVNANLDRALVIRNNSLDLAFAVLDPVNGTVISETRVDFLGTNPRRMRWDPSSGLGGVTDFTDDTIRIVEWDGQNPPTIVGTANVGSGPVGLDVVGNQIFCAGFNDDSWTRIVVDTQTNNITLVDTNPIPYTPINGGAFNPGHVRALRDPDNSLVFSNFGDDSVTFMTNAYP